MEQTGVQTLEIEHIVCPSCDGNKTIHWNDFDYPCLLCGGTGKIELKPQDK